MLPHVHHTFWRFFHLLSVKVLCNSSRVCFSDIGTTRLWVFVRARAILKAGELYSLLVHTNTELIQRPAEWQTKDAKATTVIMMTTGKHVLMHVIICETAYDMWSKLCSIFQRDSRQQKCKMLQEFYNYTLKKNQIHPYRLAGYKI